MYTTDMNDTRELIPFLLLYINGEAKEITPGNLREISIKNADTLNVIIKHLDIMFPSEQFIKHSELNSAGDRLYYYDSKLEQVICMVNIFKRPNSQAVSSSTLYIMPDYMEHDDWLRTELIDNFI